MKIESVLVVSKRSSYERYCEEERDARILQLFSEDHFTIQDMLKAHREHRETLEKVGSALESMKVTARFMRRADLRETRGHDLVITVGGDGTFLATSHHVRDRPMLGVNSSPSSSAGVFCAATAKDFKLVLQKILLGKLKPVAINRLGFVLNGHAIVEPALNELLICAQTPAATARYVIEVGRKREHHRSSGLYIGPAAGSTAVMRAAGSAILPIASPKAQWVVREPYTPPKTKLTLLKGQVPARSGMRVFSKMRNGMLYIDGPHVRYRFDYGDELQVQPAGPPLEIFGLKRAKKS